MPVKLIFVKGGPGSGFRGHPGLPGVHGGSRPRGARDLTDQERESISYYSEIGSPEINYALEDEFNDVEQSTVRHIRNIDQAISRTSTSKDKIVYKGTTGGSIKDLKPGDEYTVKGFLSTTHVKIKTRSFATQVPEKGRGRIDIVVPRGSKGLSLRDLSMHPGEDEFLLPRNTSFKVISTSIEKMPSLIGGDDIVTNVVLVRIINQPELSELVYKGGPTSGHHGHAGLPGVHGGSRPSGVAKAPSKPKTSKRVWTGEQQPKAEKRLTKLSTGTVGEKIAMKALEAKIGAPFSTLNKGINNAPIDVAGNHTAVEVKTGLASNGKTAQHWRATIGQPGKEEAALLGQMSSKEKREHNTWKRTKILERKYDALKEMEKMAGAEIKPATIGVIMSPDGKQGDVFFIPGFHQRLTWKKYATDKYYIGTYDA